MTHASPAIAPRELRHLLCADTATLRAFNDDELRGLLTQVQRVLLDRPGGTPLLSVELVTPREARLLQTVRRAAARRTHRRRGRLMRRSAARLTLARATVHIAYDVLRQKVVGLSAARDDSAARAAAELRALMALATALRPASCPWYTHRSARSGGARASSGLVASNGEARQEGAP